VVDGTYELNKNVLKYYKEKLNLKAIIFEENKGLAFSTNYGFYNSSNSLILNINDDNVCPKDFDKILVGNYELQQAHHPCSLIIHPNQIEPVSSIFKPFIIRDFGDIDTFNLDIFTEEEVKLRTTKTNWDMGYTFPFFIEKTDFLKIGGFDVTYNSPHVIDWEFFIKADMSYIRNKRLYELNFYHFGSKSARTPESYQKEREAHEYFQYKWGFRAYNKLLQNQ
jgi:hypothetical protein